MYVYVCNIYLVVAKVPDVGSRSDKKQGMPRKWFSITSSTPSHWRSFLPFRNQYKILILQIL